MANRCSCRDGNGRDTVEELPIGCFAILVHRHYLERVKDVMMRTEYSVNHSWTRILSSFVDNNDNNGDDEEGISSNAKRFKSVITPPNDNMNVSRQPSCQAIDLLQQQHIKGGRKDRRGYQLLLFQDSLVTSLTELSPLARQNISWASPIKYKLSGCHPTCEGNPLNTKQRIGVALFRLLQDADFDIKTHVLRIDTFPTEQGPDIAMALQLEAVLFLTNLTGLEPTPSLLVDNEPYSGPIEMTRSVSKCTHVLTLVNVTTNTTTIMTPLDDATDSGNNTSPQSNCYYIHLALQADHTNILLNDHASQQVWVEPTHEQTGLDLGNNVPAHAPVSRAYYKLLQVWQEYLQPQMTASASSDASSSSSSSSFSTTTTTTTSVGLDLGASPGGWTQVMLEHFPLSHVLAVDTARHLAHRIVMTPTTSRRVTHVQSDLSKKVETAQAIYQAMLQASKQQESSSAIATAQQPPLTCTISHVVCDSSTDSHRILPDVVQLMEQLSLLLSVTWTRPSFWVVTLKLPYKTSQSVQRNLDRVVDTVPDHLRRIASLCYHGDGAPVQIDYQVVHLMANSDSERTLIAILR